MRKRKENGYEAVGIERNDSKHEKRRALFNTTADAPGRSIWRRSTGPA
jgi:hypothetical protein